MKNVNCIAYNTNCVVVVNGHGIPILVEDSLVVLQKRSDGVDVDLIHCRNRAGPKFRVHALTPLHGSLVREVNPPIHQHLGGILLVCVHACRLRSPYQTLVSLLTASQVMGNYQSRADGVPSGVQLSVFGKMGGAPRFSLYRKQT